MEHYSEEPEMYLKEISDLNDLRQSIRTPERSYAGIELLTEYFNQLYFVEKRFFHPVRQLTIHFHWYVCKSFVLRFRLFSKSFGAV